jgi:hypothetical protein
MIIYVLIAIIIIFTLYKERQALGCPSVPDGTDCDNANGKAVKNTKPSESDSDATLYQKIVRASEFADKWVMWRIGVLVSVPCVFLIYFFCGGSSSGSKGRKTPTEKELLVGMFVITAIVYFTLNFYNFHLMRVAQKHIKEAVSILATRRIVSPGSST